MVTVKRRCQEGWTDRSGRPTIPEEDRNGKRCRSVVRCLFPYYPSIPERYGLVGEPMSDATTLALILVALLSLASVLYVIGTYGE